MQDNNLNENTEPDLFSTACGGSPESVAEALVAGQVLRGEVLRRVFASDDGNYAVIRITDESGAEQTLIGPLDGVLEGQDIEARGSWEQHREHGRQFRVHNFRAILPSSEHGILRYLSSGIVHGIGPKLAARIVGHFGMDTLDVLSNYSKRLHEIPGIGKKRVRDIANGWKENSQKRDVYIFLQGLGLGAAHCARLFNSYKSAAAEVVRQNPYRLASEVKGIGFLTADRIAMELGISKDSPLRLASGLVYVLEKLAENGHTCYPRAKLLEESAEILEVPAAQAEIGLERALIDGAVIAEYSQKDNQFYVYQRHYLEAENDLLESLKALCAGSRVNPEDYPAPKLNGPGANLLNEAQILAVKCALYAPVSIITGGPGVGKTTVVGHIVRCARTHGCRIMLAAPTGRAAKRLSESSRIIAKTVHRMLKWNPADGTFVHNRRNPLPCDLLILDETSMLDLVLAQQLFQAIPSNARVVLVGDRDQLPSVGAGAVLHDLITCGLFPVTELTEIFRQAENSRIVTNAHAVNRGTMPELKQPPRQVKGDFYWIDQEDPLRVQEIIAEMVAERIPKRFGFDPMSDVQVLTPMNRGNCGTQAINELLQARLNPGPKPQFNSGDRIFRTGDRVMQVVNNYDKNVFNGDLGIISSIDRKEQKFTVHFDSGLVEYESIEADQIRLAYAVTVHKSQGSEFPVVIIPLLTQHYVMLQRNLIYTGMTRARRLLIMVGTRKALAIAVRNNQPTLRFCRLGERLSAGRK